MLLQESLVIRHLQCYEQLRRTSLVDIARLNQHHQKEYGLMQVRVSYDDGYRAADFEAEQQHFERLLQQTLDTINNLRFYLRTGVNKPLLDIYPDVPL